jgi:hypothetical protein
LNVGASAAGWACHETVIGKPVDVETQCSIPPADVPSGTRLEVAASLVTVMGPVLPITLSICTLM